MKTAIISGATGFVGKHLCNALYNDYYIIGIGSNGENEPKCHQLIKKPLNELNWDLIPKIDICFHQGANNLTTETNREKMFRENLVWSHDFIETLIKKKSCQQLIYASSCSVYGNQPIPHKEDMKNMPLNPYAESKCLFETMAKFISKKYDIKTVGLRYSNIYGVGEGHKGSRASMITQILNKKRIKLFKNGEQKRDWVYIDDVIKANLLALKLNKNKIFNVGSGENTSFNDIVKIISQEKGKIEIEYIDCPFQNYQNNTLTCLKLANKLGYFPKYNIENGIKEYIKTIA